VSVDICRKLAFCSDNTTLMPAERASCTIRVMVWASSSTRGASSIHSTV